MSFDTSISVRALSKCYRIYNRPEDRLRQMLSRGRKQFYREFWALDGVSFDVCKGETLAILGRNGSGKSTLLQMICGTLDPTAGDVSITGKVAALLELGAGFNPEFTGRENVYLNGALLGIDRREMDSLFHKIADFADIGEFVEQPVKTYSSGMYVRLAFAVAIHCHPEILVVDEALSVGDFLFQQKCNRFLTDQFSGVTKLLVTHDMAAVANLADRVIVLHHGKLVHDGDPQSAIREYQIVARAEENQKFGLRAAGQAPKVAVSVVEDLTHEWVDVPESRLSGTLRAKLTRCKWWVGQAPNSPTVLDGENLRIDLEVRCNEPLDNPIIGYQVNDRFGKVIFGENSVTSDLSVAPIKAGVSRLTLQFPWPHISPEKYSLTLGIGTGFDSLSHTIECWAHNIIVLDASSKDPVHGLFNVKIEKLEILAA